MSTVKLNGYPSFGIPSTQSSGETGVNIIIGNFSTSSSSESGDTVIPIVKEELNVDYIPDSEIYGYVSINPTISIKANDCILCNGNDGITKHIVQETTSGTLYANPQYDTVRLNAICPLTATVDAEITDNDELIGYVTLGNENDNNYYTIIGVEGLWMFTDADGSVRYKKVFTVSMTDDHYELNSGQSTLPASSTLYAFLVYKTQNSYTIHKKFLGKDTRASI